MDVSEGNALAEVLTVAAAQCQKENAPISATSIYAPHSPSASMVANGLTSSAHVPKELLVSVVKIFCIKTEPNYSMPWQMKRQTSSTGSGFVISGRRIITNAHCVANQSSVRVRRHGSADKFIAKVFAVGHPCDLAILTVDDENFWNGLNPMEFGGIPHLQEAVTTVGYPTGGDNISVTKGVVSRVEETYYSHGHHSLLAIQVDAAINPGNSGGPALMGRRVVGVCFETLTNAENIGYIIPVPVIQHFLQDIERPLNKRGFCDFGVQVQNMESEHLRRSMGMKKGQSGILVNKIAPMSGSAKCLEANDVLLAIEGTPIGNDGTIAFRDGERISVRCELLKKFVGDTTSLTILRKGEEKEVEVVLGTYPYLCPVQQHDVAPSFFIFAGFVFQLLTQPYLAAEWGKDWKQKAPIRLVNHHNYHLKEFEDQELIIISQILVSDINVGYSGCSPAVIKSVNGEDVRNLKHLIHMVESHAKLAMEDEQNPDEYDGPDGADEPVQERKLRASDYLRLELEDGRVVTLNTQEAVSSNVDILQQQNVPFDRSLDLRSTR